MGAGEPSRPFRPRYQRFFGPPPSSGLWVRDSLNWGILRCLVCWWRNIDCRLHSAGHLEPGREGLHHHVCSDSAGLHPAGRPHICGLHWRHSDLLHCVRAGELRLGRSIIQEGKNITLAELSTLNRIFLCWLRVTDYNYLWHSLYLHWVKFLFPFRTFHSYHEICWAKLHPLHRSEYPP